jgi:endonuclease YncB( thermonuclease family)
MKNFWRRNRIILLVVVAVLIVGTAFYFLDFKGALTDLVSNDGSEESVADCSEMPALEDGAFRMATKVIDGDTVLIEGGYSVRLLGIDADERGSACYEAAQKGLEELVLNKDIRLERGGDDFDQWCRYLRYVFVDEVNVGLEMVEQGLAVARASAEGAKYQEEIAAAEKLAMAHKVGCKWGGLGANESASAGAGERGNYQWSKLTAELTGLEVIESYSAAQYYGQQVIVEGWVADAYRSKTNTVFLNFEDAYPNQCFVGVVFSSDQYKFVQSPEEYYAGQMVRVRGEVKEYQGKPEIILKEAEQIEKGEGL